MDPNQKQQVVERLKSANNVLLTVSASPTVDQLAACIGFTLLLNKLGKHATAVFSGVIPSTLEFLQPEKTIETNTDSLRDFIIALDKSKADKLRYKVEDEVVRIFITPYRSSLSDKDLDFSQGDFNVDAVLALGVLNKEAIDQAIVAHGRILHDATVMTVSNGEAASDVGSINWHDSSASSLSEMLVSITESFGSGLLDGQMATSFLTGIVAETDRFSNNKTSPKVMTMSAQLMAAGANQQLIATKLMPPVSEAQPVVIEQSKVEEPVINQPVVDGEIEIAHDEPQALPEPETTEDDGEIHIDDQGNLKRQEELRAAEALASEEEASKLETDHTSLASSMNTDAPEETSSGASTALQPQEQSYLAGDSHKVVEPLPDQTIDPLSGVLPQVNNSLPPLDLPPLFAEQPQVHTEQQEVIATPVIPPQVEVDQARDAVQLAALDSVQRPEATQAVGAQIVPLDNPVTPQPDIAPSMPAIGDVLQQQANVTAPTTPQVIDPMAPPPVPPPMMPLQSPQIESHHAYLQPPEQGSESAPTQL